MTFSQSNDWGGLFLHPMMKHYRHKKEKDERHPHELPEHITINSVTQLTDDEVEEHDEDIESDFPIDELEQLGDGAIPWLVTMSFIGYKTPYEFVVNSDEEPTHDELKQMLARYFIPE